MPYPQIEIIVRYRKARGKKVKETPFVETSITAATVVKDVCDMHTILWREEVLMLCLGAGRKLLGWYRVAIGARESVTLDANMVAGIAANCFAAAVILAHNHPSGKLKPSYNDLKTTEAVAAALRTVNVHFADHLIISDKGFLSMADAGYMRT